MSVKESVLILLFVMATMFCWNVEAKVSILKHGQVAPYSGYLFDEYSQTQAQIAVRQLEEYKKLQEIDKKIIAEQQSQIQNNQTIRWFYFIGGALVGGAAVNAISK